LKMATATVASSAFSYDSPARNAKQPNPRRSCPDHPQRCAQSRRRCGSGAPSPGADVAAPSPVPMQMWPGRAQSRRRCGRGERDSNACVRTAARTGARRRRGKLLGAYGCTVRRGLAAGWGTERAPSGCRGCREGPSPLGAADLRRAFFTGFGCTDAPAVLSFARGRSKNTYGWSRQSAWKSAALRQAAVLHAAL
jgi:hypothetical protein